MSKEKSTQKYAVRVISVTLISVLLAVCFVSCGGGGGGAPAAPVAVVGSGDNSGSGSGLGSGSGSSSEQSLPQDEEQFDSLSLRSLSADGEGQVDTYDLIRSFAGPNPIEAPDLYEVNHPG